MDIKWKCLRSCQSIDLCHRICLTSHPNLPDNVGPQKQTRGRCLRPTIRSKALVGYSNWRYRRSQHESQKGLSLYILLTEFCIWLPLSLLVTVEQLDLDNKAQHVCSSPPAFHLYYISNSGGRRINALAISVMVSIPSNHKTRTLPAIIFLIPQLS